MLLYVKTNGRAVSKFSTRIVPFNEKCSLQWFGNIVTMDWWDDLWLNEGFASFVEYLGANVSEPAWEMLDQMVVDDVKPVMVTDAGVNSHPIVVDVNHPDQINEVFDAISYSKGASILRMLQEILGGEAFFNGISAYLKKYEWSTATTDQLWDELGQVRGGYSVKEVMDTWTLQMGLPYINISTAPGSGGITNVMASQHRFLAHKSLAYDPNESPFRYKWFVNLDYIDGNEYKTQWITKDQDSVTFSVSQTQPVKFNVKDTGFYRVNYPDTVWRDFAQRLNQSGPNAIPEPADRTGLIDDSFNLARGGYLSYDVALKMTSYLDREFHHLPWDSAFNGITYIKDMFLNSGMFNTLRKYILTKVRPVLDKITWNDEQSSHLEKLMRSNLIQLACDFSDTDCYGNATQRFRDFVDRNISIPPNLRLHVYKYGMSADGSEADWEFLWQRFLVETVPQERVNLMYGLSFTKHVWLLNRYLDYCKDPTKILSQDFFAVVTYISRNPVGNSLAWDWVRNNWEYLVTRFTTGSRSLGRLVPSIVDKYNSRFKLQEVEDFFVKYPDGGAGSRGRDQARESIQRNIIWMRDNSGNIKDWLENNLADA
ncbi:AMPE-like protein [Mya arenaria]|uniref:AMPE-like protein n=1 Tax=Mya arenaria TaxID=6604 RepID=A0ABY7DI87_MYAAR|nr:AMPE-like protein [Mya arenaria]